MLQALHRKWLTGRSIPATKVDCTGVNGESGMMVSETIYRTRCAKTVMIYPDGKVVI